MKIDKIKLISSCLEKEKLMLQKTINDAVEARDSAPSAMESHHDTERNQNERIVAALEEQYVNLEKLIQLLPNTTTGNKNTIGLWSYIELSNKNYKMQIILVPEGYGGREIDEIKLVSISTPLGSTLFNKSVKEQTEINKNSYIITEIQ